MRLWQVLCLLLSFWGCKNIFFKTQQAPSKQKQTLFDMLIATVPDKKVPYPFSKLVDHLGQYASPVGILIPLGRSLQKTAGYPEPFKDPRRLVGFRSPATVFRASLNEPEASHIPASIAEIDVGRRLFMGYVKKAGQIEVISLLPGESEFDFQLVENYHAGSNPVIKTANKAFCRSCHQHGGPIFSPLTWDETNANRGIASLLKRHHPSGFVDGIPVEHEEDAISGSNPAYIFDSLVRDANAAIYANELWHKGPNCPRVKDPIKCRKIMVREEFDRQIGGFPVVGYRYSDNGGSQTVLGFIGNPRPLFLHTHPFPQNAARKLNALRSYPLKKIAKPTIDKLKKSKKSREVRDDEAGKAEVLRYFLTAAREISGNEIIRKKDLNEFLLSPSLTTVELNHIYDEVERMLVYVHEQDIFKNTEFDPLIKRNSMAGISIFHPFLVDVLRNLRHVFSSYSHQQIDNAITKLVADLDSPLHNARLNVVTVVRAILANLDHDLETTKWATNLSPTTTKNFTAEEIYLPDDALGRSLYKYCSSCHGKFSEYNFLHFRTKNEFCQRILSERHKLVQALETGHMPPDELIDTERDEIIKSLKTGSFAFCQ